MYKKLLSDRVLPQLSSLHLCSRSLAMGIKKDRHGYPIRPRDIETEEPSRSQTLKKAPIPPRRPAPGHFGRDMKSSQVNMYAKYAKYKNQDNSHRSQAHSQEHPKEHSQEQYKRFLEKDRHFIQSCFVSEPDHDVQPVEYQEGMMRTGLIGRKHGETRVFRRNGDVAISTLIEIQDNFVVSCTPTIHQHRDDCFLLKLAAYDEPNIEQVPLVKQKEYFSIGQSPKQAEKEFLISPEMRLPVNYKIDISHFFVGQFLDIRGMTVNRGFQGVMRRWGHKGQGHSAGRTKTHRRPGSISTQGLARVLKGRKMPGIMGNRDLKIRNVQIYYASYQNKYIVVDGPVPGIVGCFLYLTDAFAKAPIQAPLLHYPTFLGERTAIGEEVYDHGIIAPSEDFATAVGKRWDRTIK